MIYRVAEGAAGGGRQGERRERPGAAGEGPAGGLKGPQREPQWREKGAKKGLKTGLQTKEKAWKGTSKIAFGTHLEIQI